MGENDDKQECIIENKYIIKKQLGEGMFGKIFLGIHKFTGGEVAIKLDAGILLKNEARIYRLLANISGIPKLRGYGTIEKYNYMVIDRLGDSLEKLKEDCGGKFDLYTTLTLGLQILRRVKDIHNKNILHRDIKPENLIMNIEQTNKKQILYVIDFGLSKLYKLKDRHVPCEKARSIVGTVRFISLNIHKGYTPSRRDDLESIGYTLLYLLYGTLPWIKVNSDVNGTNDTKTNDTKTNDTKTNDTKTNDTKTNDTVIYDIKREYNLWGLKDVPYEIIVFIYYCRGLKYDEDPDYDYLSGLLINLYKMKKYTIGEKLCWEK